MNPATALRDARRQAGLSQAQLAERTGTSQPTISAYERGAKQPSVSTLARLLAMTGHQLEAQPPIGAPGPTAAELAERGRRLSEVLSLAEALPGRRRHALPYPRLSTLRRGDSSSLAR
jgi:transcriptional regulator with XRE-family HTH domain